MFFLVIATLIALELLCRRNSLVDLTFTYKMKSDPYIPKTKGSGFTLGVLFQNHPWVSFPLQPVIVSLNNYSFRGPPLTKNKMHNEIRIFILGDSTVADFYHNDESCFSTTLQKKLQDKFPDKFLNIQCTAVGGETWEDTFAMLIFRVAQLSPDVIIYFPPIKEFGGDFLQFRNKVQNTSIAHPQQKRLEWQSLIIMATCLLSESHLMRRIFQQTAFKKSKLAQFNYGRMRCMSYNFANEFLSSSNAQHKEIPEVSWKNCSTHLQLIAAVCKSLTKKLFIANSPVQWGNHEGLWNYTKSLEGGLYSANDLAVLYDKFCNTCEEECQLLNIPYLNCNDPLLKLQKEKWVDDFHLWNTDKFVQDVCSFISSNIKENEF